MPPTVMSVYEDCILKENAKEHSNSSLGQSNNLTFTGHPVLELYPKDEKRQTKFNHFVTKRLQVHSQKIYLGRRESTKSTLLIGQPEGDGLSPADCILSVVFQCGQQSVGGHFHLC